MALLVCGVQDATALKQRLVKVVKQVLIFQNLCLKQLLHQINQLCFRRRLSSPATICSCITTTRLLQPRLNLPYPQPYNVNYLNLQVLLDSRIPFFYGRKLLLNIFKPLRLLALIFQKPKEICLMVFEHFFYVFL